MSKMTEIEQQHQGIGDNVGNNKQTNNSSAPIGINGTQGGIQAETINANQTHNHYYNLALSSKKTKRLVFTIEGSIDEYDSQKLYTIVSLLQQIGGDTRIRTDYIDDQGSIRFILDGSNQGLQRIADLHESGELQTLLNKFKPDNLPEIIVKKAEFTNDPKVIAQAQLVKVIREVTVEKKRRSISYMRDAYLREAYLRGAYLRETYLSWAYLKGAYLRGACLKGAYLRDANLKGANLKGSNLTYANLSCSNLMGTNLSNAYLKKANLSGANLTKANLELANLTEAIFNYAIVKDAKFGYNQGVSESLKRDLIQRGAVFIDDPGTGDRSGILTPV